MKQITLPAKNCFFSYRKKIREYYEKPYANKLGHLDKTDNF